MSIRNSTLCGSALFLISFQFQPWINQFPILWNLDFVYSFPRPILEGSPFPTFRCAIIRRKKVHATIQLVDKDNSKTWRSSFNLSSKIDSRWELCIGPLQTIIDRLHNGCSRHKHRSITIWTMEYGNNKPIQVIPISQLKQNGCGIIHPLMTSLGWSYCP